MWCVCINKNDGELFVMQRTEREMMLTVLLDLKQPIPSWVLSEKPTKEGAEKYIQEIKDANDLIEKTFKNQNT